MDQDAFRKLLASRPAGASAANHPVRGSLLPSKSRIASQQTVEPTPKAEFKPRKVKKATDLSYRDRAGERRQGLAGDFAQAESLLEDFEKRNADAEDKDAVEMQRNFLGGDAEHTVLVKGLDFALLEQAKARVAAADSNVDDDVLEAAFRGEEAGSPLPASETTAPSATGKKRTREEILQELKAKRSAGATNDEKSLNDAKGSKFKPIGFKPIGSNASTAQEAKDGEGRKKKKRKVEDKKLKGDGSKGKDARPQSKPLENADAGPSSATPKPAPSKQLSPPDRAQDDEFDIFAGAGEYEGINLDEDDDDEGSDGGKQARPETGSREDSGVARPADASQVDAQNRSGRRWFDDLEPSPPPERRLPSAAANNDDKGKTRASPSATSDNDHAGSNGIGLSTNGAEREDGEMVEHVDEEQVKPMRLAPLASSAIPSIQDILSADQALEAEAKRRTRKEKRKAGAKDDEGKKVSVEVKLNREYQKLQAYTKKKGEAV